MSGGGDSSSSSSSSNTTNNTDNRLALDNQAIGISGSRLDGVNITSITNSPDAVKFMAQAGAQLIGDSGRSSQIIFSDAMRGSQSVLSNTSSAVLDLTKQGTNIYGKTLDAGIQMIDKIIDQNAKNIGVSEKMISAFQPTDNKKMDMMPWIIGAAAAVGLMMGKGK